MGDKKNLSLGCLISACALLSFLGADASALRARGSDEGNALAAEFFRELNIPRQCGCAASTPVAWGGCDVGGFGGVDLPAGAGA